MLVSKMNEGDKMTSKERLAKLHETMRALRFGAELETVGLGRARLAAVVAATTGGQANYVGGSYDKWEVVLTDGRKWTVVRDGSLSGYDSGEVVTPILTWADVEMLQSVVRALREGGARVDSSCGIHIHVDGAKFLEAPKSIKSLVKLIYSREPFIEAALGIRGTLRRERYAAGISQRIAEGIHRCSSPQALARLWYGQRNAAPNPTPGRSNHYSVNPAEDHYHSSRYHGVNIHSLFYRGTIEFRWFNGSLHAGEVKAYVQLVLAFAARALCRQAVLDRQEWDESNARRCVKRMLRKLGLRGKEFKNTREHLLKNLPKVARQRVYGPMQQRPARVRRTRGTGSATTVRSHALPVGVGVTAREARAGARTDEQAAQVLRSEQAQIRQQHEAEQGFVRPNGHLAGCTCIDCGAAYMAFMVDRQGEVARG